MDLSDKPGGFGAWCNRARRWLSGGHYAVERLLDLVQLDVMALTPLREQELARQAGVAFDLEDVNRATATGIVFTGADGVAARSQSLGSRMGPGALAPLACPVQGRGARS